MTRKILIAAGGSGGHLLPAQQLALMMKEESEILFAGLYLSKSPFFQREGFPFQEISAAPLSNLFRFCFRTFLGICQSIRLILSYRPDLVVGFGSYHSFPVLAAAVLLRKKILLYEANCQMGKVNRFFFPFSKVLAHQFPMVQKSDKFRSVPYFPWIGTQSKHTSGEARRFYGLDFSRPVCLVFGGSQGASFLNESAPLVLSECQVIHLTGKEESVDLVRERYRQKGIKAYVLGFEREMGRAYAAADFALCRSGAGTTAELLSHQIPAVMVPYPHAADDHQSANARLFCETAKGGIWISQMRSDQLQSAVVECMNRLGDFKQSLQAFHQNKETRVGFPSLIRELL